MDTLVKWQDWGKDAFKLAEKDKKPILLNLSASWCHWCHVNDKENYSDKEIADYINAHFVPINVDIDKRPDIKERYHMGGFPTIAYLNWYGELLGGGTYLPKQHLMESLKAFMTLYKTSIGDKKFNQKIFAKKIKQRNGASKSCMAELHKEIVNKEAGYLISGYDRINGGWGSEPKFPMSDALDLCFDLYYVHKETKFQEIIKHTLDSMRNLLDETEGGFFRYSVTRNWDEPHYEKLLEINSGMISNYARGYRLTENPTYKKIVMKTMEYINNNLFDDGKAFYGSQDANETYYKTSMAGRKRMQAPRVDKTVYADWNGKMISAYFEASNILKDEVPKQIALNAIHFIVKNCFDKEKGFYHSFKLSKELPGLLSDNVHMLRALIDAYQHTNVSKYLEIAEKTAEFIIKNFMGKDEAGFFDRIAYNDDIGHLNIDSKPIAENSVMAMNLVRLSKMLAKTSYKELARKTLLGVSCDYEQYGIHAAVFGKAVKFYLEN